MTKGLNIAILLITVLVVSCNLEKEHDEPSHAKRYESTVITTPDEALAELKAGNLRFMSGNLVNTSYFEQIESSKEKQTPHSVILSCMDSRVPPEIIFDQGIGNIFVTRNAGNIEDANILGSMEYAVKFAGAKLIVVMGHSHCGAVKGAIQNVESGNLTQLVNQIKPAIPMEGMTGDVEEETAKNNVKMTIKDILTLSTTINELYEANQIKIVGAFYDIETGKVMFLE